MGIGIRILLTAMIFGLCGSASAEGRLDKIRSSHVVTIGYAESSVPFSYLDGNQKPIGYTVDLCRQVVLGIESAIGERDLSVRYTPVTAATRIPLMANGTIDLECSNTTDTAERRKLVSFAPTTFVAHTVLFSRKDSGLDVNDFHSIKNRVIATQAGSLAYKSLLQLNAKENLGMNVVGTTDIAQTLLMVESGRAAAGATDDGLVYAAVASSKKPDIFAVGTNGLNSFPYAIMLPKDDPEFQRVVDQTLRSMFKSGKIEKYYLEYFESPIPPKGINLKYPMSNDLKQVIHRIVSQNDEVVDNVGCADCSKSSKRGLNYQWNWASFFDPSPDGVHNYLETILIGAGWTLVLALVSSSFALIMGSVISFFRISKSRSLNFIAATYVEIFRNIPLLVQLFLWYFVFPEILPAQWGDFIKQMRQPWSSFVPALICLSLYGTSRISEQIRAGIQSLSKGQSNAGRALGFSEFHVFKHIIFPQAIRIALPPLTSEFVASVKYSSVALTIGLLEVTGSAQSMQELTFHIFEAFTAATIIYLIINSTVIQVMKAIERRSAIIGRVRCA